MEGQWNTYDDAIGAGDGRSTALGTGADADDADGAAVEGDEAGDILDSDAQQAEEGSTRSRVGLFTFIESVSWYQQTTGRDTHGFSAVAALDIGLPGSDGRSGCGDRKKREGKRGEDSELGEHC